MNRPCVVERRNGTTLEHWMLKTMLSTVMVMSIFLVMASQSFMIRHVDDILDGRYEVLVCAF